MASRFGGIPTAVMNAFLRFDISQVLSSAQANQARFNLGLPSTIQVSSGTTAFSAINALNRDYIFTGTANLRCCAASTVSDGYQTGSIQNRSLTAIGTLLVQTGDYLDGVQNGSATILYGQQAFLYFDGQSSPATWRTVYLNKRPIIFTKKIVPASPLASFDVQMPAGYNAFKITTTGMSTDTNGQGIGMRYSADGVTFRSGSSDYSIASAGQTQTTALATLSANPSFPIMGGQGSSYNFAPYLGCGEYLVDATSGNFLGRGYSIDSSGNNGNIMWAGFQATATSLTTPNYLRFYTGGNITRMTMTIEGIP